MLKSTPADMILEYPIEQPDFIEWSPVYFDVANKIIHLINPESNGFEIHHVGSSSVPDCGGKGSIDLAAAYENGDLEKVKMHIDGLGFQRQKTRNPFPESRPMRTGAIEHQGKTYKIHIHILAKGSDEFQKMISFRESLRNHPEMIRRYTDLKRKILKESVRDSIEYSERKGDFFK